MLDVRPNNPLSRLSTWALSKWEGMGSAVISPADPVTRSEILNQAGKQLNRARFGQREFDNFLNALIRVTGGEDRMGVRQSPETGPNALRGEGNSEILLVASDHSLIRVSQGFGNGNYSREELLFYRGYGFEDDPDIPKLQISITRTVRPQSIGNSLISGEMILDFPDGVQVNDVEPHRIPDTQARAFLRRVLTYAQQGSNQTP